MDLRWSASHWREHDGYQRIRVPPPPHLEDAVQQESAPCFEQIRRRKLAHPTSNCSPRLWFSELLLWKIWKLTCIGNVYGVSHALSLMLSCKHINSSMFQLLQEGQHVCC